MPQATKIFIRICSLAAVILFITPVFSETTNRAASWDSIIYMDHLDVNPNILYEFMLEGRFRDQPGIFYQGLAQAQIGYRLSKVFSAWAGYSAFPTVQNINSSILYYDQYWYQQINEMLLNNQNYQIISRERVDEFSRKNYATMLNLYRQLIAFDFPILKFDNKFTPFISDELFLNMNKPQWGTLKTFDQNRLMLGVNFKCAGTHICQVGYLNQYYEGRINNYFNHILYLSFII